MGIHVQRLGLLRDMSGRSGSMSPRTFTTQLGNILIKTSPNLCLINSKAFTITLKLLYWQKLTISSGHCNPIDMRFLSEHMLQPICKCEAKTDKLGLERCKSRELYQRKLINKCKSMVIFWKLREIFSDWFLSLSFVHYGTKLCFEGALRT